MEVYEYFTVKGDLRSLPGDPDVYGCVADSDLDSLSKDGWRVVSVAWDADGDMQTVLMERERNL